MGSTLQIGASLLFASTRRREGCIASLVGEIDETFDRAKFVAAMGGGAVVIDLDGVKRITSYGVREWLRALKDLDADYYCFIRCRPSIVSQFNMVSGFACNGQLVTFYAPYRCPICEAGIEALVDLREQHAEIARLRAPVVKCEACGPEQELELDDMPAAYFAYAAAAPCPAPPAHVLSLLDPRPPLGELPFKVEKEIVDDLTVLRLSGSIDKRASLKRLADGLEGNVLVLLGGVREMTAEGLTRFLGFTQAHPTMFLAQVGLSILDAWKETPDAGQGAPLVTVSLPMRCRSCGLSADRDLGKDALERALLQGSLADGPRCSACHEQTELVAAASDQARLALRLAWAAPPPPVEAALRKLEPLNVNAAIDEVPPGPLSESSGVENVTFGKYKLVRRLGYGGMAEIFLARQRGPQGFEKKVALKRILPSLCQDEGFVTMFLQEARLAARLSHPNIVQVLDLGQAGDQYFIALEYVRGYDLRTLLRSSSAGGTRVPVPVACRIVADTCGALSAAHTHRDDAGNLAPIVHRDVSPQNVLVSTDGAVKLTDFGIAKASDAVDETEPGSLKGTPSYMSPERILRSSTRLDPRPDLFAIGVVLYECLVGERPFKRATRAATMEAILTETPPVPSSLRSDLPAELDTIVLRAMSRDEKVRYADARSMQLDIENFLVAMGKRVTAFDIADWVRSLAPGIKSIPSGPQLTPTGQEERARSQLETLPAPPAKAKA